MHRTRFLGLVWCSTAACWSLMALAAQAGVAHRSVAALLSPDGHCRRYGLAQCEDNPHRYVHSDYLGGNFGDDDSSRTDREEMASDDLSAEPAAPAAASEGLGAKSTFYEDVGGSSFDCPCDRSADNAACELTAGDGGKLETSLRSLFESLGDWRHSAGEWVVDSLNAEQDGLDETTAHDVDWTAIGEEMARRKSPLSIQSPTGADHSKAIDDDCDVEGNVSSAADEAQEPGVLSQWCGQIWEAARDAALSFSQQLDQWTEEVLAAQGGTLAPSEAQESESREQVDEASRPRDGKACPGLPNYFLPAFGSPWDGDHDL